MLFLEKFRQKPIMGILRGVKTSHLDQLIETVLAAGLETLEITMNTDQAADLIKHCHTKAKGRLTIGAGTVLSIKDLQMALKANAQFIVCPNYQEEIVHKCKKECIPVFPGALTPQEIFTAWQAGATMVKVFPANLFGPDYLKTLKGPFKDIQLLACGGVNEENIKTYFAKGASGVAFGSSIFNPAWIEKGEYSMIKDKIQLLIANLP